MAHYGDTLNQIPEKDSPEKSSEISHGEGGSDKIKKEEKLLRLQKLIDEGKYKVESEDLAQAVLERIDISSKKTSK